MKIFLDANIFLRYLTQDDPVKYTHCHMLIEVIEEGKCIPYTSNIVFLELFFILTRHYKFSRKEVLADLFELLQIRNLTLIETTSTTQTLSLMQSTAIQFPDAMISTQIPQGAILATYDRDFSKLKT